jgi:hypothetical protein
VYFLLFGILSKTRQQVPGCQQPGEDMGIAQCPVGGQAGTACTCLSCSQLGKEVSECPHFT